MKTTQALQNSLDQLKKAEAIITEQLKAAVISAIDETARETNDKDSARRLIMYLTDTFSPEPVSRWLEIIELSVIEPEKAENGVVTFYHSYYSGYSEFKVSYNFLDALAVKILQL